MALWQWTKEWKDQPGRGFTLDVSLFWRCWLGRNTQSDITAFPHPQIECETDAASSLRVRTHHFIADRSVWRFSLSPPTPPQQHIHVNHPPKCLCHLVFKKAPCSAQGSQSTSSGPIDPIISSSWWITFSVEKRFGRKKPSGDNRTWKSSV